MVRQVEILPLVFGERYILMLGRNVQILLQQLDKAQRQGAVLVEGTPRSNVRVDNRNALLRFRDPADGEVVRAGFMDRNTEVVSARTHDLGEELPHLFGKRDLRGIGQASVNLESQVWHRVGK